MCSLRSCCSPVHEIGAIILKERMLVSSPAITFHIGLSGGGDGHITDAMASCLIRMSINSLPDNNEFQQPIHIYTYVMTKGCFGILTTDYRELYRESKTNFLISNRKCFWRLAHRLWGLEKSFSLSHCKVWGKVYKNNLTFVDKIDPL